MNDPSMVPLLTFVNLRAAIAVKVFLRIFCDEPFEAAIIYCTLFCDGCKIDIE